MSIETQSMHSEPGLRIHMLTVLHDFEMRSVRWCCTPVRISADKALVSAGVRVLNVVGVGADLAQARERATHGLRASSCPGSHFRTDIGATEVVVPEDNS
ncbi:phosphoribosylglycinamide synthetase C domain-containing protein [Nocardia sp. NPDC055049]